VAGGGVDGFVGGRADATVVATDSFSRVVAAGWGALGMGGTYGVSPKTAFTVQNGTGLIALVPGAAEVTATPTAVAALDVDLQASLAFELSVGDSASVALAVRRAGAEGEYRARLLVQANGTVLLRLLLRTRTGTVPLTGEFTVPGGPLAPGAVIHLEVAATGVAPTVLTARAWTGDTPPATWALTAVNAEPMLQVSGGVGVRAKLAGAATTPVGVRVDDLLAVLTTV
ncbi:MAG: hypothetical protein ABI862_19500, partial [Ilumatobacteraceae bacterium]